MTSSNLNRYSTNFDLSIKLFNNGISGAFVSFTYLCVSHSFPFLVDWRRFDFTRLFCTTKRIYFLTFSGEIVFSRYLYYRHIRLCLHYLRQPFTIGFYICILGITLFILRTAIHIVISFYIFVRGYPLLTTHSLLLFSKNIFLACNWCVSIFGNLDDCNSTKDSSINIFSRIFFFFLK